MNVRHHPSEELLLAYAAGALDQAASLLVACHLTFCPRCRAEVEQAEAAGGALLEDLPPDVLPESLLSALMDRLGPAPVAAAPVLKACASPPSILPRPLRKFMQGDLAEVRWKRLGRGLEQTLILQSGRAKARLYRIAPGVQIPEHGHDGIESTLVLQGGFSDEAGHYLAGDVAEADERVVHRPVADSGEACICLAVTDAPLRLSGLMGRLVSPFLNL